MHGIWRSVLRGARGLILWDEDNSIVRPDASPGPRAAAYAPVFAALRGDIGRRLIACRTGVRFGGDPVFAGEFSGDLDARPSPRRRCVDATGPPRASLQDNAWRVALRGLR